MTKRNDVLALLGGEKAIGEVGEELFRWPIVTEEMEAAVIDVLRRGAASGLDITQRFEEEFAAWIGRDFGLAHNNGTAAVHSAMFGIGIGRGDEVICPSMTYWASCAPVYSLGGTVSFADIDPQTLCIDPADIEHHINERTKAIIVVHYAGMPADMESIMSIARSHNLAVIEDCSHSHGSRYKGRLTGTFGDVAVFSLMSAKSFPIGEGGILLTDDRRIYERAVAFGHYARHASELTLPDIEAAAGIPWGGYKYRLNQFNSAIGRVQLKLYPEQMAEIDRAMNTFWDVVEGVPGLAAHRPSSGTGSTKGGWYFPLGLYRAEELEGLSVSRFCQAVRAEGVEVCTPGCNLALHLHPLFNSLDVYGDGRPTRVAFLPEGVDIRQGAGSLPVSERIQSSVFKVPWFRRFDERTITQYAQAFRKVALGASELIDGDGGNPPTMGGWGTSTPKRSRGG